MERFEETAERILIQVKDTEKRESCRRTIGKIKEIQEFSRKYEQERLENIGKRKAVEREVVRMKYEEEMLREEESRLHAELICSNGSRDMTQRCLVDVSKYGDEEDVIRLLKGYRDCVEERYAIEKDYYKASIEKMELEKKRHGMEATMYDSQIAMIKEYMESREQSSFPFLRGLEEEGMIEMVRRNLDKRQMEAHEKEVVIKKLEEVYRKRGVLKEYTRGIEECLNNEWGKLPDMRQRLKRKEDRVVAAEIKLEKAEKAVVYAVKWVIDGTERLQEAMNGSEDEALGAVLIKMNDRENDLLEKQIKYWRAVKGLMKIKEERDLLKRCVMSVQEERLADLISSARKLVATNK